MSFIQRFSTIGKGSIVFTGNTLGLSKRTNSLIAGTSGSIGAFISLDQSLQRPTYPSGTTLNYLENGSSAILNLPANSEILYAELIWGGLYKSTINSIENLIDDDVQLITPDGTFDIPIDQTTKQNFIMTNNGNSIGFYMRSSIVTNLIKNDEQAEYSVLKVPALIEPLVRTTSDTNHAGWTLAVIYSNTQESTKSMVLWVGGELIMPPNGTEDVLVTGFQTPIDPPVQGKLFISIQEGDAIITNDQMLFGKDAASLQNLSGPNNPELNFFCSQINDKNGLIDTSGTFGDRNANSQTATNIVAGRQGWDITSVDISNEVEINQNQALIRFKTEGDLYLPNAVAIQIDSRAAELIVEKGANKEIAQVGEEIEYTISVKNEGGIIASNVFVDDILPDELTLIPGSITVDNVAFPDTIPIDLGTIAPDQTKLIEYKVLVDSIPEENPAKNIAQVDYTFEPFQGTIVIEESISNEVEVFIYELTVEIIKSVDKAYAIQGEELTYTSVITNTSSVKIQNLFFKDSIPSGTSFVDGSVVIDTISFPSYNPQIGFSLNNLLPQDSTKISFKVVVL